MKLSGHLEDPGGDVEQPGVGRLVGLVEPHLQQGTW